MPLTVSLLIGACALRRDDSCAFDGILPSYVFWECPVGDFWTDFVWEKVNINYYAQIPTPWVNRLHVQNSVIVGFEMHRLD